eukprot:441523-Pyramimonas_sp.AAC.1
MNQPTDTPKPPAPEEADRRSAESPASTPAPKEADRVSSGQQKTLYQQTESRPIPVGWGQYPPRRSDQVLNKGNQDNRYDASTHMVQRFNGLLHPPGCLLHPPAGIVPGRVCQQAHLIGASLLQGLLNGIGSRVKVPAPPR